MKMDTINCEATVLPAPPGDPDSLVSRVWLEKPAPGDRLKREGALLGLVALVVALSAAMPALKARHLWVSIPCVFEKVTGLPCLTCGLTRSFAFTAHGRLDQAFGMHLLGPPLFFAIGAISLYLSASLATGLRVRYRLSPLARKVGFWILLAVFVACWIIKLVFMKGAW